MVRSEPPVRKCATGEEGEALEGVTLRRSGAPVF
jgi:hypothetical protein